MNVFVLKIIGKQYRSQSEFTIGKEISVLMTVLCEDSKARKTLNTTKQFGRDCK